MDVEIKQVKKTSYILKLNALKMDLLQDLARLDINAKKCPNDFWLTNAAKLQGELMKIFVNVDEYAK